MVVRIFYNTLDDYVELMKLEELREGELPREYAGEWLLIFDDEIIEHSPNVEEILRLAEELFPPEKLSDVKITKVLTRGDRLYYE